VAGTFFKRISVAAIAATLAAVIAGGCTGERFQDRFKWNEIISSITLSKRTSASPVYLDLVRVMPLEWERFYMFPPYTRIADIQKVLGFNWGGAKKTRINERDDITLLVFVIGQTVQDAIEQPRVAGDFSRLKPGYPYSPREGYFEVIEENEGGKSAFYFVEAERYPEH